MLLVIKAYFLFLQAILSLSSGLEVKFGNIDQYGISIIVYVIPQTIYITEAKIYNDVPDNPQLVNKHTSTTALTIVPIASQGSIGGSLLVGGFGLQIMDFLGKGNAQDGFTRFAWVIAIVFIVTVGINNRYTACKSIDLFFRHLFS
mgnify:CR=1 FL=1